MAGVDVVINLRADGVSVLLDLTDGRLPAIVHWGGDLGALDLVAAEALMLSGVRPHAHNIQDEPVRLAVLPEHWSGWTGRPGLSGDRGGGDWSPKFETMAVRIDGSTLTEAAERRLVSAEMASVQVDATDHAAQLGCRLTIELGAGGVLRAQAEMTNLAARRTRCTTACWPFRFRRWPGSSSTWPVAGARSGCRNGSRWSRGTHLREGRRGRTGADAATLLHLGEPGFGFGSGEIWAVHAGWSGNHTHYAERVFDRRAGDRRRRAAAARRDRSWAGRGVHDTVALRRPTGVGLDEVAHRFHRFLRARPGHPRRPGRSP